MIWISLNLKYKKYVITINVGKESNIWPLPNLVMEFSRTLLDKRAWCQSRVCMLAETTQKARWLQPVVTFGNSEMRTFQSYFIIFIFQFIIK